MQGMELTVERKSGSFLGLEWFFCQPNRGNADLTGAEPEKRTQQVLEDREFFSVLIDLNVITPEHAERLEEDAISRKHQSASGYLIETGFLRNRELRVIKSILGGLITLQEGQQLLVEGRLDDSTVRVHRQDQPDGKARGRGEKRGKVWGSPEQVFESETDTVSLVETREAGPPDFARADDAFRNKLAGVDINDPVTVKPGKLGPLRSALEEIEWLELRDELPGAFADVEAIHRDGIPLTGKQLGEYLLLRPIGRGGSAWVFFGIHKDLERPFAVKVLHPSLAITKPQLLKRFKREAMLLMKLDHPSIVRVSEFDYIDEHYLMAMDYVEGLSVSDFIEIVGRLKETAALRIALEVIEGLSSAFELDIVHRDIKPSNIIITKSGGIKLTDFGLARWVNCEIDDPDQTQPLSGIGTPYYSSPEQMIDARKADFRADFYSLGATLYHMLTGRPPFQGSSAIQVMRMHAAADPTPPMALNSSINKTTNDLVLWLLDKNPDNRPQSHSELLRSIRSALQDAVQDNESTASLSRRSLLNQ